MPDRQPLVFLLLGLCIFNGIFSPFLTVAIPITAALMPELFPRTLEWVLFWSSILLSSATLLFSGVPVAVYERLSGAPRGSAAPLWIWLCGAGFLSLPALGRFF